MSGDIRQDAFGFDIRGGRAMVSLGPLSAKRFCTYNCAFCYVHADFASYPKMSPVDIRVGLEKRRSDFDIIYVSGDTDSFAPGRTEEGLQLLEQLTLLGADLLFTTRAPLGDEHLNRLEGIDHSLRRQGRSLFGCISISRLRSAQHIEPKPVPSPERRIEVLRGLKQRNIFSILAMRPFLPVIPVQEYVELARMVEGAVDAILGEVWYADQSGILERQVFGSETESIENYQTKKMDFDGNDKFWKVWEGAEVEQAVSAYCASAGIPFYMRSQPAIQHLRQTRFSDEKGVR